MGGEADGVAGKGGEGLRVAGLGKRRIGLVEDGGDGRLQLLPERLGKLWLG